MTRNVFVIERKRDDALEALYALGFKEDLAAASWRFRDDDTGEIIILLSGDLPIGAEDEAMRVDGVVGIGRHDGFGVS